MDLGLGGRTYVVTGGSRGLGFAVATVLADEGANVVVSARDATRVAEAIARISSPNVHGVAADLTAADTPGRLITTAREQFGGLDGAFVNHGGPEPGPAAELDDDTLQRTLELAVVAPVRMVREVARQLSDGAIVALTSSTSVQPIMGLSGSNVARPGMWGYVKTLAEEVGPRGVRVNVLLPGRFATQRVQEVDAYRAAKQDSTPEEVRSESERNIPLRRLGDPIELARVAAFLMSPAASYVTGAAWAVDGGLIRSL